MTVEIAITLNNVQIAEGTYDYCAAALGYSRGTLVSYAGSHGKAVTRLKIDKLPPLYRLCGDIEPITEEEACSRLGFDRLTLQTRASDQRTRKVCRYMREPWALPSDEIERLWRS